MADSTPKSYHTDPTLYLYTSLTAGSSHIISATSRLETILKANRIPFKALDVATDEKARMLWGRRAGKRKLPGLVRMGLVVGDLDEVEEWNEYGELKDHVGTSPAPLSTPTPSTSNTPSKPPPSISTPSKPPPSSSVDSPITIAMRQAGQEAAKKAGDAKSKSKVNTSGLSDISAETLQRLDNSAPTGMPPPSGTTDASSAKAPETSKSSAESKADTVSSTSDEVGEATKNVHFGKPGGPSGVVSNPEKNPDLAKEGGEESKQQEEKEDVQGGRAENVDEVDKTETSLPITATNEAQALPGTRTQDQAAASADDAGASVAD